MISLDEVRSALIALGLTSIMFEDYLLIMKTKFDMTIAGEPYHARTMLYNTKTGRLLSRIWGRTVISTNVLTLDELEERCKQHFQGGRLCLGLFLTKDEQEKYRFHISLTPVFRKLSKVCLGVIGGETSVSSIACKECNKLLDLQSAGENLISVQNDSVNHPSSSLIGTENIDLPIDSGIKDETVYCQLDLDRLSEGDLGDNHVSEMNSYSDSRPQSEPIHFEEPKNQSHALRSCDKPLLTYPQMIAEALMQAKGRMLPLSRIYTYINHNYPFYRMGEKTWMNAIRHNLTVNTSFYKVARSNDDTNERGSFWKMKDGTEKEIFKRSKHKASRHFHGDISPSIQSGLQKSRSEVYLANQALYMQEIAQKYPHIIKTGKPFKIKIKTEDSKGSLHENILLVDPTQTLQQGEIMDTPEEKYLEQGERFNSTQNDLEDSEEELNSSSSFRVNTEETCEEDHTPYASFASNERVPAPSSFGVQDDNGLSEVPVRKELCQICKRSFAGMSELNRHVNEIHFPYEKTFRCPMCYFRATSVEKLLVHIKETNHCDGTDLFKCPKCLLLLELEELQSHYPNCTNPQSVADSKEKQLNFTSKPRTSEPKTGLSNYTDLPFPPKCGAALDEAHGKLNKQKESQLWIKNFYDKKSKQFNCPYCSKGFKTSLPMWHHMRLTHLWGSFSCPECDTVFSLMKDLTKHMYDSNHDRNPFVRCGSGYGAVTLQRHTGGCRRILDMECLSDHYVKCVAEKIKKMESTTKELSTCEVCGKVSKGRKAYKAHFLTHSKREKTFQCDKCPKTFLTNHAVQLHIKRAHEHKYDMQDCSICGETFRHLGSLKVHKYKAHGLGEAKVCPLCGFKCITNTNLKSHMMIHAEPTLKCSYCEKMFKSRKNLESHERLHTGEKPYVCTICGAGFPSRNGLDQHKKGVHKVSKRGGRVGWHRKKSDNSH